MNTEDSQQIVRRFFEALELLKEAGVIGGTKTFTTRFEINRWNLLTVRKNPASDMFQPAWLTYLVTDYGVSARWLLTGLGEPLPRRKSKTG